MNAAAHYFVNGMESEASPIARGLRRRDPDLLDRLIEQYQHRLLRNCPQHHVRQSEQIATPQSPQSATAYWNPTMSGHVQVRLLP